MNIGEVAERTGLPAKTIRYYEDIGLVTPAREANSYRVFSEIDAHKLQFLGRARALGFSIEDCRNLLALWEDQDRASADVRAIAQEHLDEIEAKIKGLTEMRNTLADLVQSCAGDKRPDCPILKGLEGP
ncbi:Cu(I)-responsive transcriptional regulator [Yoonia sediminilitoris]|uniref:Cu(I)-responsive transcriptional regulator n=1 Tax=Yoonia sediminilitoris TaxID=1286148 RepID=A0A2T6K7M4_9RHOB|nr:Cu(I)-responsive transcriptional regulator [Yoonia sediminilitoris]PUB10715.1 Cu(I)-responsive transcriptional regulator [Yoonia sediminilitoris]RCW90467.1 Cu(I)-responsive transcriptional regulator [Yoonia sediminilitoris]